MKNLLYKEFTLMLHPVIYIFPLLSGMLLIPDYPYFVPFGYAMLTVFMMMMLGREYKDNLFTAILPVSKQDQLMARCAFIVLIQLMQIATGVVCAVLRYHLIPTPNALGLQANVTLFACVLVMYGVFNLIFLFMHYKTAYHIGVPAMVATMAGVAIAFASEFSVRALSFIPWLNSTVPADMLRQIPLLLVGVAVYAGLMYIGYKISLPRFEKVDI